MTQPTPFHELKIERSATSRNLTYLQAIYEAQLEEMEHDDGVVLVGEDIESSLFGTTSGFVERFGSHRVRNLPISEAGFTGVAIGAAMTGLRPVVDFTIASLMFLAADQLINQAARNRYMFGGQVSVPAVFRATMLHRSGSGAQHADRTYPTYMTVPGLKIITPSSPYDVKGMLKSAIRDDDPVICLEGRSLWSGRSHIPEEEYLVPLGRAEVKRPGGDVTVVAIADCVPLAMSAAERLANEDGIQVEVVDPRTLLPLDWPGILGSVERTGRLVAVDSATRTLSPASEIVATVSEELFGSLESAPRRITAPDVPAPCSPALESQLYPTTDQIVQAVRASMS
jgi:pyruvate/2-oxoglutarate/acetoin dehydrogenase E1 component